jgi:hypothetical protein
MSDEEYNDEQDNTERFNRVIEVMEEMSQVKDGE